MQAAVVIPTYERPDALEATVESVCKQSASEYEVIVVDDGSESDAQRAALTTVESAHDRVRVIRTDGGGPATARNRGWRATEADVILFTDDDCLVPREWVARLVGAFEPGVGAVGGPLIPAGTVASKPVARLHTFRNESVYELGEEPVIGDADLPMGGTANIAYQREALEAVDGFDETFPTAAGEDADLQKRVSDAGYQMKYVPVQVEHNDEYDFRSFVSRTIRHGKGTFYYHRRHGTTRPLWRVVLGLLAAPFFLPAAIRDADDLTVACLAVVERVLLRVGEAKAHLEAE